MRIADIAHIQTVPAGTIPYFQVSSTFPIQESVKASQSASCDRNHLHLIEHCSVIG